MKVRFTSLFCALLLPLHAQETDSPEPPQVALPPREAVLDTLFAIPGTKVELDAAIFEARKLAIPEQTLLEARFLFHVEHKDDQGIIDLLPALEEKEKVFTLDSSEIFATKEDFLAVIEFSRSLQALKLKKYDEFKKHITEALWLSPAQASAFTPYIEKLRIDQHIANAQISYEINVSDLHSGAAVPLKSVLAENQAVLLHFWSPWSPDCETSLTDLGALTKLLSEKKVALASILIDGKTEIVAEAKDFLKGLETQLPGPQLLDRQKNSLAGQMRVTDLPTMVLLDPKGKMLFHGKPGDPLLEAAIKQVGAAAKASP